MCQQAYRGEIRFSSHFQNYLINKINFIRSHIIIRVQSRRNKLTHFEQNSVMNFIMN